MQTKIMRVTLLTFISIICVTQVMGQANCKKNAAQKKIRARDLGIPFDGTTGKYNSITDVAHVDVGFSTIIKGDSIRTGVTAIFPRGANRSVFDQRCFANWFSLNGNGEMTGIHIVNEMGYIGSPLLITNTNSVGVCRDSLLKWIVQNHPVDSLAELDNIGLPIVAETWDGFLNDYREFNVGEEHVYEALNNAKLSNGVLDEGNVGGGTGMISFGFKAGTGTSSRIVEGSNYTVGVLVQSNFGRKRQLIIAGVPVGREMLTADTNTSAMLDRDVGSIIVILATDAPFLPTQLKRLATRVSLGIGKLGGIGADSSGDIFLAFSTAEIHSNTQSNVNMVSYIANMDMNPFFDATIQCVEEAIINSMIAAETMIGYNGLKVSSISHDHVQTILKKYNRFNTVV